MIARAVALATTQVLGPDDFAFLEQERKARPYDDGSPLDLSAVSLQDLEGRGLDAFLDACERRCLEAAMETYKTQKEAADALGLTPTKLHRLLKKHGFLKRIAE